jgi:hypothetical protein
MTYAIEQHVFLSENLPRLEHLFRKTLGRKCCPGGNVMKQQQLVSMQNSKAAKPS